MPAAASWAEPLSQQGGGDEQREGGSGALCVSFSREARTLLHAVNPNLISQRNNEEKERSDLFPAFCIFCLGIYEGPGHLRNGSGSVVGAPPPLCSCAHRVMDMEGTGHPVALLPGSSHTSRPSRFSLVCSQQLPSRVSAHSPVCFCLFLLLPKGGGGAQIDSFLEYRM